MKVTKVVLADGRLLSREDFLPGMTKMLQDFGYPDLTEEETGDQLDKLISGEAVDVVGGFISRQIDFHHTRLFSND